MRYEHLLVLNDLANQCSHITEFGVGFGNNSTVFLNSTAIIRNYDIRILPEAESLFEEA